MLPGEVTGCDGPPLCPKAAQNGEIPDRLSFAGDFPGRFRRGWHDRKHAGKRRRQEQVEEAEESRRMREKRFELQRIFGADQYDAGGHRQACPDGRGAR